MSDRTDRKLEEVAVARYSYRHDAEFAAGFLTDADIPHRLQLDDPGIGVSLGSMATIWVLAMDVPRARELLEVDERPVSLSGRGTRTVPPRPAVAPTQRRVTHASRDAKRANRPPTRAASGGDPAGSERLGTRARAIALLISGGVAGMGGLFLTEATLPIVGVGVAIASAGFALMGILGRAPGALGRFLHAVAGNAP
jgi:hypothetical protein